MKFSPKHKRERSLSCGESLPLGPTACGPTPSSGGHPPQRPRSIQACREIESASPAARSSRRPRLLQPLSRASWKTGTYWGIPASPSYGQIACGIPWSRVPSLTDCLRLAAAPLVGGGASDATMSLPATKGCPRHFALSGRPQHPRLHPDQPVC